MVVNVLVITCYTYFFVERVVCHLQSVKIFSHSLVFFSFLIQLVFQLLQLLNN